MATFALVHGAWHGGWAWDLVRAELESRGHGVFAPDLPCDDTAAGLDEHAAVVPAADIAVGHSLGGHTIARVPARLHVFVCALVPGADESDAFAPGFGAARVRDELGRSYYPDPLEAARELQYPPEAAHLAHGLRPQAPVGRSGAAPAGPRAYVVCAHDAAVRPEWQRRAAREQFGVEPIELEAGHSPMLTHPLELAVILESVAREAGVV